MVGEVGNKANTAQLVVEVKVGAELGNTGHVKLEKCSKILALHVNASLKDVNQDHLDFE